MSRFRRTIHGVASSYVLLAATAFYQLASVPIALHYLDKERFGLWALMSALVGYLGLIDAGMTGSAGRLIIDHKDDRDSGSYGGLIKTVLVVTLIQGLIIFLTGLFFAGLFGRWLAIPADLRPEFIRLMILQCSVTALGFATRIFSLMLGGHQRMDLVNYGGTLSLAVNFAALWMFFHFGFGVLSLAWASFFNTAVIVVFQWVACGVLGFFPRRGSWGRVSWFHFKEIFAFGKDLFLVNVGWQLITASQTIIITRMLGLPAAAIWSVGLRAFNLVLQVIWRLSDMSGYAFAEMMVRGEVARLRERYRAMVMLTASLGSFAAVSFALCNSLFVPLWTHGKIQWPVGNDVLLGGWMVVLAVQHCHSALVLLTKRVGFLRYVYFIEGAVFVTLALLVSRRGGLPAIIACSVVCSTVFSGAYCTWRVSRYLGFPLSAVAFRWMRLAGIVLLGFAPPALLCWWATGGLKLLPRLAISGGLAATLGSFVLLRFGLPVDLQAEFQARAPAKVGGLLARILGR
ncbi:MAG: lipopolysaccharide biosynthesis protein [Limisphaerales bacterium]